MAHRLGVARGLLRGPAEGVDERGSKAMTARDKIRRRYRQFLALGLSGLAMFLGSIAVMLLLVAVLPDDPTRVPA